MVRLMGLGWDHRLHETNQKKVYAWVEKSLSLSGSTTCLAEAELTWCLHKVMKQVNSSYLSDKKCQTSSLT